MLETPEQVRQRLTSAAELRLNQRMQTAGSIGGCDAALYDHKFALKRINALTDADLSARAIDIEQ